MAERIITPHVSSVDCRGAEGDMLGEPNVVLVASTTELTGRGIRFIGRTDVSNCSHLLKDGSCDAVLTKGPGAGIRCRWKK